jgi:hypothetical protein
MSMTLPHGLLRGPNRGPEPAGWVSSAAYDNRHRAGGDRSASRHEQRHVLGVSDLARPTIAEELRGEARSADAVAEHAGKSLSCQPT